jgi:flagellar biogenesis protein FliO
MQITSRVVLNWASPSGVALKFDEVGTDGNHIYRMQAPSLATYLPKAATVKLREKKLVVDLDKEILPLDFPKHEGVIEKNKTAKSVPILESTSVKVVGSLLILCAAGLGLVFYLKRRKFQYSWKAFGGLLGDKRLKKAPLIETVATHSIGPKRQIVIVRAGGEYWLIGCTADNMTCLGRIDEQTVDEEDGILEEEVARKTQARRMLEV